MPSAAYGAVDRGVGVGPEGEELGPDDGQGVGTSQMYRERLVCESGFSSIVFRHPCRSD
jgi:hypothetical protein